MTMVGDGQEGQPTEGVATLESMASMMDGGDEAMDTSEESAADEDAEESEEVETSDEGGEEGEEEGEEPVFTIKVDGKEINLKQSELIESAQKGFDYTQKTMAVAEERKAVESERAKVREVQAEAEQRREQAINDLRVLHAFMEDQIGAPPDISLAAQDAHQYLVAKEWHESQRAKLGQVQQALQTLLQQQESERTTRLQQRYAEVEQQLVNTLPGWKDAPVEKFKEASDYLQSVGLTPERVGETALELGFWQLAHKAREFDRLMAERAKLKPKSELPKVHKPGGNQPPQLARRQEALKRHKASPSIQTLADLL